MCQNCDISLSDDLGGLDGRPFWWGDHFAFFTHGRVDDGGYYRDGYCPHYDGTLESDSVTALIWGEGAHITFTVATNTEASTDEIFSCYSCFSRYMLWALDTFDVGSETVVLGGLPYECHERADYLKFLNTLDSYCKSPFHWNMEYSMDRKLAAREFCTERGRQLILSRRQYEHDYLWTLGIQTKQTIVRAALLPLTQNNNDVINKIMTFAFGRMMERVYV